MSHPLVAPLHSGPIDIVGDIHGEYTTLMKLLSSLGYQENGEHPNHRKLVFVGDFCDRGPQSPEVIFKIKEMVDNNTAQAIIGNHELNLLINDKKDGSGWYFDERIESDNYYYAPYSRAAYTDKTEIFNFLNSLPVALENNELRVVHACWEKQAIIKLKSQDFNSLVEAYDYFEQTMLKQPEYMALAEAHQHSLDQWADQLENPKANIPYLQAIADYELFLQRANPLKLLTSGFEVASHSPYFLGNKWRFTARTPWWDQYDGALPVVVGHYWRLRDPKAAATGYSKLFAQIAPTQWHGHQHKVFCVDFSIGASWRHRHPDFQHLALPYFLGALRWPENTLHLHTGESWRLHTPG